MMVILSQIAILILQKKYGSRFFLPLKLRSWNEHNYYHNVIEDDIELQEMECCICLSNISLGVNIHTPDSSEGVDNGEEGHRVDPQPSMYMQTPCNHKFHIHCLKPWMNQKLECPKCRAELPPLDEEEY